jgi:extracellular factor (EF) 3-hydroxypalmitic acid methyl ester biosynthesis protein
VYSKTQIDPVVSFRNSQGELVRGTIINLQRKSLVMEVYNPYSIVQVSEVLSELSVKMGTEHAYSGKAVVISMVNTGLTAVVSVTLIDEWRELSGGVLEARAVGEEAPLRARMGRAFPDPPRLSDRRQPVARVPHRHVALGRAGRSADTLPKEGKSLREDFFLEPPRR